MSFSNRGAPVRLSRRAVLGGAAALLALMTGGGRPAAAQTTANIAPAGEPMTAISSRTRPYTETLRQIERRNRQNQQMVRDILSGRRPAPPLREIPNVYFKPDWRRLVQVPEFLRPSEVAFPAPPFVGVSDGRIVPSAEGAEARAQMVAPDPLGAPGAFRGPLGNPLAPQNIGLGFPGVTLNEEFSQLGNGSIPPDTMGAVGPSHFVENINGAYAIYNKAGTRLSLVSLNAFFTVVVGGTTYPRNGAFDPRILFDRRSGRWFATAMEFGNPSQTNNGIILAVSRTDDATGTWDKYFLNVGVPSSGGTTFFTDYSTLGTDDNGVYFGMRIFVSTGGNRAKIVATGKASLLAASPSLDTLYQTDNITDLYSSPQPAHNLSAAAPGDRAWIVASSVTVFGNVNYRTITWSGGVPTLSATGMLTTPAYDAHPAAPASGSAVNVETGDDRLQMAVLRNNRLWTCRIVGVNSTGGATSADRDACEWLELNTTNAAPALVQSGRVYDPAASDPRFYYYPSIMVSGQGHVAMGYSGSKTTEFIGAYTSGRLASDPLGTLQSIALIKAGEGAYTQTFGGSRNRWGDYSYTSQDPNDDMTLWTVQEYAAPAGSAVVAGDAATTGRWATWIAKLLAPAPTLNNPAGRGMAGQTGVTMRLTGTGLFDPGTGFLNRLSVVLTGGAINGISNYQVTYDSPTSVTVRFDIAANASPGARNIVLTNPDGQTVTITNGFTVLEAAPRLVVTRSLARVGSEIVATITVTNSGSASATDVRITEGTLIVGVTSTPTTTTLPVLLGTLAPGESQNAVLRFPGSAGTAGTSARLRVLGTFTNGTFGGTSLVTLP